MSYLIHVQSMLLLLLGICLGANATAQNDSTRPLEDRIEAQRIAFITETVDLTSREAQAFWPLFNAYRKDEKALKAEKSPSKSPIDMDDAEARDHIQHMLATEQKILDRKKIFVDELEEVLSPKKIMRLFRAERQFKERLLRAINRRKNR